MRVLFVFVESKLLQEYFHDQFRAHLSLVEPVNKCYNIVNCHNLCFETATLHIGTCFIILSILIILLLIHSSFITWTLYSSNSYLIQFPLLSQAYNAFASRVASLKRKLDLLKSTLPGPEDSPIPSPSEDAPSPTGSDSPFLGLGASRAQVDPELDGKAMDDGEMPSDNRDMEDMDVSDEEAGG